MEMMYGIIDMCMYTQSIHHPPVATGGCSHHPPVVTGVWCIDWVDVPLYRKLFIEKYLHCGKTIHSSEVFEPSNQ